jgi:hypothetical protein
MDMPYAGLYYNHILHTIPILMESSPYRRLVDMLCTLPQANQRHAVLQTLGLPYNSGSLLVAPWVTWTPETHMRVALPRLIDAVQVLLLALNRLRLWLPPPLLRRIIEQAISLAAPRSRVQQECAAAGCEGWAPVRCTLGLCHSCCRSVILGPPCSCHYVRM